MHDHMAPRSGAQALLNSTGSQKPAPKARYYCLDEKYSLRGWRLLPTGLVNRKTRAISFLTKEQYALLLCCDGTKAFAADKHTAEELAGLEQLERDGLIRSSAVPRPLPDEQAYRFYGCRCFSQAAWSITGKCNFRCRHCLLSAPTANLGEPTLEQCLSIIRSLASCGIQSVDLTGGEPLVRKDFPKIIKALQEYDIAIGALYTNGYLLNDGLLDLFEACGCHPNMQISYDGSGCHDWLRGVPGAEEAALRAIRLCTSRGFDVCAKMCLNRRNKDVLGDTVKKLLEAGCRSLAIGLTIPQGSWQPEAEGYLSPRESYDILLQYIPWYFAQRMPIDITLGGLFHCAAGSTDYDIPLAHSSNDPAREKACVCEHARHSIYISPAGKVLPCMGMAGNAIEAGFPSLFELPLKNILQTDSHYVEAVCQTIGAVLEHNPECAHCRDRYRCGGGCRAAAIGTAGTDYLAPDRLMCTFFQGNYTDKVRQAADQAIRAIIS